MGNPTINVTGSNTFKIGYVSEQPFSAPSQVPEFSVQAAGALRSAPITSIFNINGDAKVNGGYNETRFFYYWGYFALPAPNPQNSPFEWPTDNAPGTDKTWPTPPSPPSTPPALTNTVPPIPALTVVANLFFTQTASNPLSPVRVVADWVDLSVIDFPKYGAAFMQNAQTPETP